MFVTNTQAERKKTLNNLFSDIICHYVLRCFSFYSCFGLCFFFFFSFYRTGEVNAVFSGKWRKYLTQSKEENGTFRYISGRYGMLTKNGYKEIGPKYLRLVPTNCLGFRFIAFLDLPPKKE